MWRESYEERRQRIKEESFAHFLQSRGGVGKKKPKLIASITYGCSVQPLNGDLILIGPYRNKKVAMVERMKTVKKLIEQGNAREFDIQCFRLYEMGYFEDYKNNK